MLAIRNILSMMCGDYDIKRVFAAYIELEREVEACLDLATKAVDKTRIYPRTA